MSLKNKTVLVTRRQEQSDEMVREIERRGGKAIVVPMIETRDPDSWNPTDEIVGKLTDYDAIIFASANAVDKFLLRCKTRQVVIGEDHHIRIYAVGEKTREAIERFHLVGVIVPGEFSVAGLASVLRNGNIRGMKFLIPRGDRSNDKLPEMLRGMGASVDTVIVYRTVRAESGMNEARMKVLEGTIDALAFASPSAIAHFAELFSTEERQSIRTRCVVGVIGPSTEEAAREAGFDATVVAQISTGPGLIQAISDYYQS